jgi:PAS domain S-box-containing protein
LPIPLRVLILEDRLSDVELILHELRRAGFEPEWQRVETRTDYLAQLHEGLDVILADYTLPQFDALRALHLWQERGLDIPFIVVTGSISEEVAVECMKEGAADYLLKDRLARLGPAVANALQEKKLRDKKRQAEEALRASEQRYRQLFESIGDAVMVYSFQGRFVDCNEAALQRYGYSHEEFLRRGAGDIVHPDFHQLARDSQERIWAGEAIVVEAVHRCKDGRVIPVEINAHKIEYQGDPAILAVVRDITERNLAEEEIRHHLERIEALLEIDKAIISTLDLAEVLDVVLRELERVIPYHSAGIFLLADGVARLTAGRGFPDMERVLQVTLLVKEDALTSEVLREGRPLVLADAQADDRFLARGGTEYVRSWIGVPLIVKGKAVGFLTIDHREPGVYDEESAEMAWAFGSQVAIAIENARLYEEARRRFQHMQALRKIDTAITASLDLRVTFNVILDQVITQLGVDAADVLLLSRSTSTLEYVAGRGSRTAALQHTRLRLGEGYAGQAALENRIISISNVAEAENGLRRSPLLWSEEFIAYHGVPLIAKGKVKGVLEIFHRAPLDPDREWLDFLQTLAGQAAIAIDNAELFEDLQRSNVELTLAYDTTLKGWAHALELRDHETEGHTRRVTEMTLRLARAMGMSEAELVHVRRGALLHDIGKIGVSDTILLKPGPLTDEEWQIMRRHPTYAYELLLPIHYLRPALDIPYCHHEKWDGTGYPQGLEGEEIPLAARIFAVVDVWDALLSDRPYRPAWSEERVIEYLREEAGKHFDPQVVEVFLGMMGGEE